DHGQSQGATFRDRYGLSLEELVREKMELPAAPTAPAGGDPPAAMTEEEPSEARAFLRASLSEVASGATWMANAVRRIGGRRIERDDATAGEAEHSGRSSANPPEVVVMASGCLGLISFPREAGRVPLERIDELHPELLAALRTHPG